MYEIENIFLSQKARDGLYGTMPFVMSISAERHAILALGGNVAANDDSEIAMPEFFVCRSGGVWLCKASVDKML